MNRNISLSALLIFLFVWGVVPLWAASRVATGRDVEKLIPGTEEYQCFEQANQMESPDLFKNQVQKSHVLNYVEFPLDGFEGAPGKVPFFIYHTGNEDGQILINSRVDDKWMAPEDAALSSIPKFPLGLGGTVNRIRLSIGKYPSIVLDKDSWSAAEAGVLKAQQAQILPLGTQVRQGTNPGIRMFRMHLPWGQSKVLNGTQILVAEFTNYLTPDGKDVGVQVVFWPDGLIQMFYQASEKINTQDSAIVWDGYRRIARPLNPLFQKMTHDFKIVENGKLRDNWISFGESHYGTEWFKSKFSRSSYSQMKNGKLNVSLCGLDAMHLISWDFSRELIATGMVKSAVLTSRFKHGTLVNTPSRDNQDDILVKGWAYEENYGTTSYPRSTIVQVNNIDEQLTVPLAVEEFNNSTLAVKLSASVDGYTENYEYYPLEMSISDVTLKLNGPRSLWFNMPHTLKLNIPDQEFSQGATHRLELSAPKYLIPSVDSDQDWKWDVALLDPTVPVRLSLISQPAPLPPMLVITPQDEYWNGRFQVRFTAYKGEKTDENVFQVTQDVNIQVRAVNSPPYWLKMPEVWETSTNLPFASMELYNAQYFADRETAYENLQYSFSLPSGIRYQFDQKSGKLSLMPLQNVTGDFEMTVRISDGQYEIHKKILLRIHDSRFNLVNGSPKLFQQSGSGNLQGSFQTIRNLDADVILKDERLYINSDSSFVKTALSSSQASTPNGSAWNPATHTFSLSPNTEVYYSNGTKQGTLSEIYRGVTTLRLYGHAVHKGEAVPLVFAPVSVQYKGPAGFLTVYNKNPESAPFWNSPYQELHYEYRDKLTSLHLQVSFDVNGHSQVRDFSLDSISQNYLIAGKTHVLRYPFEEGASLLHSTVYTYTLVATDTYGNKSFLPFSLKTPSDIHQVTVELIGSFASSLRMHLGNKYADIQPGTKRYTFENITDGVHALSISGGAVMAYPASQDVVVSGHSVDGIKIYLTPENFLVEGSAKVRQKIGSGNISFRFKVRNPLEDERPYALELNIRDSANQIYRFDKWVLEPTWIVSSGVENDEWVIEIPHQIFQEKLSEAGVAALGPIRYVSSVLHTRTSSYPDGYRSAQWTYPLSEQLFVGQEFRSGEFVTHQVNGINQLAEWALLPRLFGQGSFYSLTLRPLQVEEEFARTAQFRAQPAVPPLYVSSGSSLHLIRAQWGYGVLSGDAPFSAPARWLPARASDGKSAVSFAGENSGTQTMRWPVELTTRKSHEGLVYLEKFRGTHYTKASLCGRLAGKTDEGTWSYGEPSCMSTSSLRPEGWFSLGMLALPSGVGDSVWLELIPSGSQNIVVAALGLVRDDLGDLHDLSNYPLAMVPFWERAHNSRLFKIENLLAYTSYEACAVIKDAYGNQSEQACSEIRTGEGGNPYLAGMYQEPGTGQWKVQLDLRSQDDGVVRLADIAQGMFAAGNEWESFAAPLNINKDGLFADYSLEPSLLKSQNGFSTSSAHRFVTQLSRSWSTCDEPPRIEGIPKWNTIHVSWLSKHCYHIGALIAESPYDLKVKDSTTLLSAQFRNPAAPLISVDTAAVEAHRIPLRLEFSKKDKAMAGSALLSWNPGSNCEPASTRVVEFGSIFPLENELVLIPSFASSWSSSVGFPAADQQQVRHQWVDLNNQLGGGFAPYGTGVNYDLNLGDQAPHAPRLSMAVDVVAAGDYELWVKPYGMVGEVNNAFYWGWDSVVVARQDVAVQTTWKGNWQKSHYTLTVGNPGRHTLDLFMASEGFAFEAVAIRKIGGTATGEPSVELAQRTTDNGWTVELALEDLPSSTDVSVNLNTVDRYANRAATIQRVIRTRTLPQPLPDAEITLPGLVNGTYVRNGMAAPELMISAAIGAEMYMEPTQAELRLLLIGNNDSIAVPFSAIETGESHWKYRLDGLGNTESGYKYVIQARLLGVYQGKMLYGDWSALRFDVREIQEPFELAEAKIQPAGVLGLDLVFEKGALKNQTEDGNWYADAQFRVSFADGLNMHPLQNDLRMINAEIVVKRRDDNQYDFVEFKSAGTVVSSQDVNSEIKTNSVWSARFGKYLIRITASALQWQSGFLVATQVPGGPVPVTIIDGAGIRRPVKSLKLGRSGVVDEFEVSGERFVLRNVVSYDPAAQTPGLHLEGCRTYFSHNSVQGYRIVAAGENSAQASSGDCAGAGPILDFELMHPSTDKSGYRFHHGLPEAVELHYADESKPFEFADSGKVWPVTGIRDTLYYDRYQMMLSKVEFSWKGVLIADLDLFLAPDLQHIQDSLMIHNLSGSWIKGYSSINEGHLHIYGTSQAEAQTLTHRRHYQNEIPMRYTYSAPDGWEMISDARGSILVGPRNETASLELSPVSGHETVWSSPSSQILTLPVTFLRFSAEGWDSLSARGDVDLKSGHLNFKGELLVENRQRDYSLEFQPSDDGVFLDVDDKRILFDTELMELRPDLTVRRLRATPRTTPSTMAVNLTNVPSGLLQAIATQYSLEDYEGIPVLRLQPDLLKLGKISSSPASLKLPLGDWSTKNVQTLIVDGHFRALELQARFVVPEDQASLNLQIGSVALGTLNVGEVVLGLGRPAKDQTRLAFALQNTTLTFSDALARFGWKNQIVRMDTLRAALLMDKNTIQSYHLEKFSTILDGAPRVLPITLQDLVDKNNAEDRLVDSTKGIPIIELRTGERPLRLSYPSSNPKNREKSSFDLELQDLTLEFTKDFPVHGLRHTALQLNLLGLEVILEPSLGFRVQKADLKATKDFNRLVLLDPAVLSPALADPKKVIALHDVTLSVAGAKEDSEWNGSFEIRMKDGGMVELLGRNVKTTECRGEVLPANTFSLDWNGAIRTLFCVEVNDTIPLYKEDGKILVGFAGAAATVVPGSPTYEIQTRSPMNFQFKAQAGGGLEPRFSVGVKGDFYFGHSGNYPQTLDFLAANYSGQKRRLSLYETQVGIDKYGLRAERASIAMETPDWAKNITKINLDLAALTLSINSIALQYWRTADKSCEDSSIPGDSYTYDPEHTEHCLKLEVVNTAKLNLFDQCSDAEFSVTPTLRANVRVDPRLKFTLEDFRGLSASCSFLGFRLDLDKVTLAKEIKEKERWGLFADQVKLTANRPEVYGLLKASGPIWIRVDDFELYNNDGNPEFGGRFAFGPASAWSGKFDVNLLGLGLSGEVAPATLFTGVKDDGKRKYGILIQKLFVTTPPTLGSLTLPLGFDILFNAQSPYVHPISFSEIAFNVPLKLSEAVRGEVGLKLSRKESPDSEKKRWVLTGNGQVAIPNFVREARVDLSLVKPDKINVTGVEEGRIIVKLDKGSRIPLGTTGLYITGLMGGLYDGYGQPSLSKGCAVGKLPPGLKGEMSVFIEDETGEVLQGEVGVWVQMNALNFGVDGKLKLIKLLDAKICAALSNGVLRSKASVELDKALYVKGEFQMDVWSEKGKKNVAASASAKAGIGKGSIYKSRWFKIPGSRKTFGGVFTNFGRFTNGKNGFTTGVKVLGKKYSVGLIGGSFKVGGSYKLAAPSQGNMDGVQQYKFWTYEYDSDFANTLFTSQEVLSISASTSTLPWDPELRIEGIAKEHYEILEYSTEENNVFLAIRFLEPTYMKDFYIVLNRPVDGAVGAEIEGSVARQLLEPEITSAHVDSTSDGLLFNATYRGYKGADMQTDMDKGLCYLNEPVVLVRRAVANSNAGRYIVDDEQAVDGFSNHLNLNGGDLETDESVQIYVGPRADSWNDTLWQALPASAFDSSVENYWDLSCITREEGKGYVLNNCALQSMPVQNGTYEFAMGSRLWAFDTLSSGLCTSDPEKATAALHMADVPSALARDEHDKPFWFRWMAPTVELIDEPVQLQVHVSKWEKSWSGADERRKAILTWSDVNADNSQIHGYKITYYPQNFSEEARSVVVGAKVTSHEIEFPSEKDYLSLADSVSDNARNAWLGDRFTVRVEPVKQVRLKSGDQEQVHFLSPGELNLHATEDFVLQSNSSVAWKARLSAADSPVSSPALRIPRNRTDSLNILYELSEAVLSPGHSDADRHVDLMARWLVDSVHNATFSMPSVHFSSESVVLDTRTEYAETFFVRPGMRQATCRELISRKPVMNGEELLRPEDAYILDSYYLTSATLAPPDSTDPSSGKTIVPRGSYVLNDTLFTPDLCRSSYENRDDSLLIRPTPYGTHKLEVAALNRAARMEPANDWAIAPKTDFNIRITPPRIDMNSLIQQYYIGKINNSLCFEVSRDLDWNPTGSGYGLPEMEVVARNSDGEKLVFRKELKPADTLKGGFCPGDTRDRSDEVSALAYTQPYRISIQGVFNDIADSVQPLEMRIVYREVNGTHRVRGDSAVAWLIPGTKSQDYTCPTEEQVRKLKATELAHLMEYIGPVSNQFDTLGGTRFLFSEVHHLAPLDWGVNAYEKGKKDAVIASFVPVENDLNKYWIMDESGFYFKPPQEFANKLSKNKKYDLRLIYQPTNGSKHACSTVVATQTFVEAPKYRLEIQDADENGTIPSFKIAGMRSSDQAFYSLNARLSTDHRYTDQVRLDQTSPISVSIVPSGAPGTSAIQLHGLVRGLDSLFLFTAAEKKIANGVTLNLGERFYPMVLRKDKDFFNPRRFEDYAYICQLGDGDEFECSEGVDILRNSKGRLNVRLEVLWQGRWYIVTRGSWVVQYNIPEPVTQITMDCSVLGENDVLHDYPLQVSVFKDANLQLAQAILDSGRVHFRDANGVEMPAEIEQLLVDREMRLGAGIAWVHIPEISRENCPVIGVYPGSGRLTNVSADIWNDDFRAVWHFSRLRDTLMDLQSDAPAEEIIHALTDKKSAYKLDPVVMQLSAGPWAGALLAAADVELPKKGLLVHDDESFTISQWIQIRDTLQWGDESLGLFQLVKEGSIQMGLTLDRTGALTLQLGDSTWSTNVNMIVPGNWYHVALVYNKTTPYGLHLYLNGIRIRSLAAAGADMPDFERTDVRVTTLSGKPVKNVIADELRVMRTASSPAWIRMDYMTQRPTTSAVKPCADSAVFVTADADCALPVEVSCNLQTGDPVYLDRNFKIDFLADSLKGATQVRTAFASQGDSSTQAICLDVNRHATVYALLAENEPIPEAMATWRKTEHRVAMRESERQTDSLANVLEEGDNDDIGLKLGVPGSQTALRWLDVYSRPVEPGRLQLPGPGKAAYPYSLALVAAQTAQCLTVSDYGDYRFEPVGWKDGRLFDNGPETLLAWPDSREGSILIRSDASVYQAPAGLKTCRATDIYLAVERSRVQTGTLPGWILVASNALKANNAEGMEVIYDLYKTRQSSGLIDLHSAVEVINPRTGMDWILWTIPSDEDSALEHWSSPDSSFQRDTSGYNPGGSSVLNNSDRIEVRPGTGMKDPFLVLHFAYPVRVHVAVDAPMVLARAFLLNNGWALVDEKWIKNGKSLLVYRKDFDDEESNTVVVPTPALDGLSVDPLAWEVFVQRLGLSLQGYSVADLRVRSLGIGQTQSANYVLSGPDFKQWKGQVQSVNFRMAVKEVADTIAAVRNVLTADMLKKPLLQNVNGEMVFVSPVQDLADLIPLSLEKRQVEVRTDDLGMVGSYAIRLRNQGDAITSSPFYAVLYEDRNGNLLFDNGIDSYLGEVHIPRIPSGEEIALTVNVNGAVHHPGSLIWMMLDPDQWVVESNRINNMLREKPQCMEKPALQYALEFSLESVPEAISADVRKAYVLDFGGKQWYALYHGTAWNVYDTTWTLSHQVAMTSSTPLWQDLNWDGIPEWIDHGQILSWTGEPLLRLDLDKDGYLDDVIPTPEGVKIVSGWLNDVLPDTSLLHLVQKSSRTWCSDVQLSHARWSSEQRDTLLVRVGNSGTRVLPSDMLVIAEELNEAGEFHELARTTLSSIELGAYLDAVLMPAQRPEGRVRITINMPQSFLDAQVEINSGNNHIWIDGN